MIGLFMNEKNMGGYILLGILREVFPISESDILRKHQVLLRKTEYYTNCGHKVRSLICKIRLSKIQNKYA